LCYLGVIATHYFPITTTSSMEVAEGMKLTIDQLHDESPHDVKPPCKILCYAVSAGYSRIQNSATCTNLCNICCSQSCYL